MLQKLKKDNAKGFTIIEVMIVLAIVGAIILIVFLAVPTLQRNSRNTQRKSDVGRISSAATTVSNNNGANTPAPAAFKTQLDNEMGSLGYYPSAKVTVVSGGNAANTNTGTVIVATDAKCNSSAAAVPATNQIAVLYAVETGGTPTPFCLDT